MKDSTALILIIITFFAVIILSRIINLALEAYFLKPVLESEALTFIICFIIHSIAGYGILKFGCKKKSDDTLYLIFLNAMPFTLFYLMSLGMIDYFSRQIINFLNFIS